MGRHEIEPEPRGASYGPALPILFLLALVMMNTIARLDPGCWSMGFCG